MRWYLCVARSRTAVVLVPGAVMLTLGLWGLERGSVWRDEAATLQVATRTLPEIWRLVHTVDAVHGLYYLLMHFVLAVDAGEFALRLPSVLAATVTACLVALLGGCLAGPRVGLLAGSLYGVSPFAAYYAQEGRSYALVAAAATAATLALVRAVERPSAGAWAAYGALVTGAAWLHELAVLLLLAHAVTLSAARVGRAVWRGWAGAAGAAVLLVLPLVAVAAAQSAQVAWLRRPGLAEAEWLLRTATGRHGPLSVLTLLLIGLAVVRPPARRGPGTCGLVAVALPLAVVPTVVLFAVSQAHPLYLPRYVFFAFAGVPLLTAAGVDTVLGRMRVGRWRDGRVPALAGACLIVASFCVQLPLHEEQRTPLARRDDFAAVARVMAHELRPGDALLYVPMVGRRLAEVYPESVRGVRDVSLRATGRSSGTLFGQDVDKRRLGARMACLRQVWVLFYTDAARPGWSPRNTTEQAKLALLRRDFTPVAERRLRSGVLRRYTRKAQLPAACGSQDAP
ncbi:glycosyltransferase family 39 protein [Streptomyces sp. S.PNR 29]|uniref:glycosyltransferase family 39 protein n=1 Tax=Streptomyces sp. S.PNR 29 TaxID=2973805 RepID=UPI0025AF6216|nr:glycosyltransferase family 39 protein [Streptomyces sp. S.PNR 29]MDN0197192.1 glycosyltransferase family 39 protein [Streptomyces sp. S.PNR 29]